MSEERKRILRERILARRVQRCRDEIEPVISRAFSEWEFLDVEQTFVWGERWLAHLDKIRATRCVDSTELDSSLIVNGLPIGTKVVWSHGRSSLAGLLVVRAQELVSNLDFLFASLRNPGFLLFATHDLSDGMYYLTQEYDSVVASWGRVDYLDRGRPWDGYD